MSTEFIIAQIVGFFGYSLYACASFAKSKRENLIFEIATLFLIIAHWYMLNEMVFVLCNLIWIYFSFAGLVKDKHKKLGTLMLLSSVPMILIASLSQWSGHLTDYTILIGMYVVLASRYFTNEFNFRCVCVASALFALFNVSWTASVPSIVFSIIFLVGHLRAVHMLCPRVFTFTGAAQPLRQNSYFQACQP